MRTVQDSVQVQEGDSVNKVYKVTKGGEFSSPFCLSELLFPVTFHAKTALVNGQ